MRSFESEFIDRLRRSSKGICVVRDRVVRLKLIAPAIDKDRNACTVAGDLGCDLIGLKPVLQGADLKPNSSANLSRFRCSSDRYPWQ